MIENQNITNDVTVEEKVDGSGEDVILAEEENATSIYNLSEEDLVAKTANAVELTLNDNARVGVSGSFSCTETTECWYKFIVPETAIYEIYTSHGIPTIVLLYDSSGDCIIQCKSEGERTDTFISQELQMNQVCYICVLPCNSITGSFYLTLSQVVHAKSISITPKRLHLQPNVASTNSLYYTSGLHVKFDPVYTTNKKVHWTSSNPSIVESGGFDGYIRAQPNKTGRVYITATAEDGNHQAVAEISVGDLNGEFYIINERSNKFLSAKGKYVTQLSDSHELICADEDGSEAQIWKFTPLSNPNTFRVESQIDPSYAMNANVGDTQCNATLSKGDANDSIVYFEPHGGGYYKIKTNSGMCLTANPRTGGAGVIWSAENTGESQYWYLSAVDMVRRETEKVEYHLVPYSDIGNLNKRALQVDMNTPNDKGGLINKTYRLTNDEPLELATFSYVNKQKWLIKGTGSECKIYTPHGNNYCLCKKEGNEVVHVSNKSTVESLVTVSKYNNSNDLVEVKLTASGLYLTVQNGEIIWAAYDNTDHSTQVWKKEGLPSNLYNGCDTNAVLTNDTVRALKYNNETFVIRYYGIVSNFNGVDIRTLDKETGQSLIGETLSQLSNQGILWENENFDYLQYVDQLFEIDEKGEIVQLAYITYVDKTITPEELKNIKDRGLKVVVVYQNFGNGAQHFTTDHAKLDAFCALVDAKRIGQPYGSTIYFAVDFDATDMDQITAYFDTIKKVIKGRYKIGVYGSGLTCKTIKENCDVSYTWLCQSTGYAEYPDYDTTSKYNIKQAERIVYNDVTFDDDVAVGSDYGQWDP